MQRLILAMILVLLPSGTLFGQYLGMYRDSAGNPVSCWYAGSAEWLARQEDPESHLHEMDRLEAVVLYVHDISLPEIRYIASLKQVRFLDMGYAPEGVGMEPGVLDVVGECTHLEGLQFCKCDLTNDDAKSLVKLTNLKSLMIEGGDLCRRGDQPHGFTDEAVDSLVQLKSLEELFINGDPGWTDQTLEKLAALPKLEHLNLYSSNFTDAALEIAASRMKLKSLWMKSPHFTDEAMTRLRESKKIDEVSVERFELSTRPKN